MHCLEKCGILSVIILKYKVVKETEWFVEGQFPSKAKRVFVTFVSLDIMANMINIVLCKPFMISFTGDGYKSN